MGGRREEEETEICSNTPPPFPSYFTRNSWYDMNYLWFTAEFPLTLFKVHIYCITEAATTCTSILLLWHICIVCHSITLGICCSVLMIY